MEIQEKRIVTRVGQKFLKTEKKQETFDKLHFHQNEECCSFKRLLRKWKGKPQIRGKNSLRTHIEKNEWCPNCAKNFHNTI